MHLTHRIDSSSCQNTKSTIFCIYPPLICFVWPPWTKFVFDPTKLDVELNFSQFWGRHRKLEVFLRIFCYYTTIWIVHFHTQFCVGCVWCVSVRVAGAQDAIFTFCVNYQNDFVESWNLAVRLNLRPSFRGTFHRCLPSRDMAVQNWKKVDFSHFD